MQWKITCIDEDIAKPLDVLLNSLVLCLGEEGAPLSVERLEEPTYRVEAELDVDQQDIDLNDALRRFRLGVDP